MQALRVRVEGCRTRLDAQNRDVTDVCREARDLQSRFAALKESIRATTLRLQAVELRAGQAAVLPPSARPAPLFPRPAPAAAEPSRARRRLAGAAGIALLGAALGCALWLRAPKAPPAAPAPAAPTAPAPRAPGPEPAAQSPGSPEDEALRLVYEYRPPGAERGVLDLVGAQQAALGPSPWVVECASETDCSVSYNQGETEDEEPLYEFEVDLAAKTVTASPETALRLQSATASQSSDD